MPLCMYMCVCVRRVGVCMYECNVCVCVCVCVCEVVDNARAELIDCVVKECGTC